MGSTHDLTNEGYLSQFSKNTINGKRYNWGYREYFSTLGIKLFISRGIDDTKGKLTDIKNMYTIENSDFESWQDEIKDLVVKFNEILPNNNYENKAEDVINKFDKRNNDLKIEINKKLSNTKTFILV